MPFFVSALEIGLNFNRMNAEMQSTNEYVARSRDADVEHQWINLIY